MALQHAHEGFVAGILSSVGHGSARQVFEPLRVDGIDVFSVVTKGEELSNNE
jgi:hypothetical protein